MNYYNYLVKLDDRYFYLNESLTSLDKAASYAATYMFDTLGFLYPEDGRFQYKSNKKLYEELRDRIRAVLPRDLAEKTITNYRFGRHDT